MNLDFVETLRKIVVDEAVERGMRNIPQLQIPYVEFVCPASAGYGQVYLDIKKKLSHLPNVTVKQLRKGTQYRVRMEYRT